MLLYFGSDTIPILIVKEVRCQNNYLRNLEGHLELVVLEQVSTVKYTANVSVIILRAPHVLSTIVVMATEAEERPAPDDASSSEESPAE